MEFTSFFSSLGTKVSVLEYASQILPGIDSDLVRVVEKRLVSKEVVIRTKFTVLSASYKGKSVVVQGKDQAGKETSLDADLVVVSTGRKPYTQSLHLERTGVRLDPKDFIVVNPSLQTSVPSIYAIGDCIPGPFLAHRASYEALVAASHIAGDRLIVVDYRVMPSAIFTEPEIASVGISETEAKEKGIAIKVGKFPFAALGRALANLETEGFCKVIGDAKTNDLLGMHVVGSNASNLIAEGTLAIEMGAHVEDLALTIHTHPSYPEAIMEAAKVYGGHAIHIFQPSQSRHSNDPASEKNGPRAKQV